MTMYIMFVIDFNEKINYLSKYAIKICSNISKHISIIVSLSLSSHYHFFLYGYIFFYG